jgi:hypothetical protein
MPRALNFEYLNRQLVWHELSELLLFLLPLVNVTRIRAFVLENLPQMYQPRMQSGGGKPYPPPPTLLQMFGVCGHSDYGKSYTQMASHFRHPLLLQRKSTIIAASCICASGSRLKYVTALRVY